MDVDLAGGLKAELTPDEINQLMERFAGLTLDEGRALYATLSPAEQAAMDAGGLKQVWRSMSARKAHARRKDKAIAEFQAAVSKRERLPLRLKDNGMQASLDKALRERTGRLDR